MSEERIINPEEKLQASTSMEVRNNTDEPVSVENWTVGFGFRIDTVNLAPGATASVKAEYVWYDFRAKNMGNKVIAETTGVYFNRIVILTKNPNGTYSFLEKKK